jgi:hypothetical protein
MRFDEVASGNQELSVELREEGRSAPFTHTFDVTRLEGTDALHQTKDGWRFEPNATTAEHPGKSLRLWWHGGPMTLQEDSVTPDPEVRRQLEALGYL